MSAAASYMSIEHLPHFTLKLKKRHDEENIILNMVF